jgi:hypothetical protein
VQELGTTELQATQRLRDWAECSLEFRRQDDQPSAKALLQFATDNNLVFDIEAKAAANSLDFK